MSDHSDITVKMEIDGISCASCVARIEDVLAALPGVLSAQVSLPSRSVQVALRTPEAARDAAEALSRAGYAPRTVQHSLRLDGLSCASCVARAEKAALAVPGVLSASVNLATGVTNIEMLAGAAPQEALFMALASAGYPATNLGANDQKDAAPSPSPGQGAIWAAVLTLPVVVLAMGGHASATLAGFFDAMLGQRGNWLVQGLLTTAVMAGPGRAIFTRGMAGLRRASPDMNSLVVLGTSAAWVYSMLVLAAPALLPELSRAVYFEAAAVIITLVLAGRALEARAHGRTGQAIARLLDLAPPMARREAADGVVDVPLADLSPGDVLHVRPGDRVPVDGVVIDGTSFVDASLLSGESHPVAVRAGSDVTGGTLNTTGSFRFRATRTGSDTALAGIVAMVEAAQAGKLPIQALIDRVALWFVPAVMAIALMSVLVWLVTGPTLTHALIAGVSVLIVACPCAMGLATPVSIMVGTGRAAEMGVLLRRGEALQALGAARWAVFDKTGTLTHGKPRLTDLVPVEGIEEGWFLAMIAAAESGSEHPVASAIGRAAEEKGLTLPACEEFSAVPGQGVVARVQGQTVLVGNEGHLAAYGIAISALREDADALSKAARSPIFVAIDGAFAGILAVSDAIKPGAAAAVARLQALGLRVMLLSGDRQAVASAVARDVGIGDVVAGALPDQKLAKIAALKGNGGVIFIGDGINDAPALAGADVGIAMGAGTDVAIESADVVLARDDPAAVADAISLSRQVMNNIRQNLFWAFAYNVILIPVAAGALYPVTGTLLSPMLAAGAMALSSLCVLANALRLTRAGRTDRPTPRPTLKDPRQKLVTP